MCNAFANRSSVRRGQDGGEDDQGHVHQDVRQGGEEVGVQPQEVPEPLFAEFPRAAQAQPDAALLLVGALFLLRNLKARTID